MFTEKTIAQLHYNSDSKFYQDHATRMSLLKCLEKGCLRNLPAANSSEVLQLSFVGLNAHFSPVSVSPPAVTKVVMRTPEKHFMVLHK